MRVCVGVILEGKLKRTGRWNRYNEFEARWVVLRNTGFGGWCVYKNTNRRFDVAVRVHEQPIYLEEVYLVTTDNDHINTHRRQTSQQHA